MTSGQRHVTIIKCNTVVQLSFAGMESESFKDSNRLVFLANEIFVFRTSLYSNVHSHVHFIHNGTNLIFYIS